MQGIEFILREFYRTVISFGVHSGFHNFSLGILHVHMNVSESITQLLIANCRHAA